MIHIFYVEELLHYSLKFVIHGAMVFGYGHLVTQFICLSSISFNKQYF